MASAYLRSISWTSVASSPKGMIERWSGLVRDIQTLQASWTCSRVVPSPRISTRTVYRSSRPLRSSLASPGSCSTRASRTFSTYVTCSVLILRILRGLRARLGGVSTPLSAPVAHFTHPLPIIGSSFASPSLSPEELPDQATHGTTGLQVTGLGFKAGGGVGDPPAGHPREARVLGLASQGARIRDQDGVQTSRRQPVQEKPVGQEPLPVLVLDPHQPVVPDRTHADPVQVHAHLDAPAAVHHPDRRARVCDVAGLPDNKPLNVEPPVVHPHLIRRHESYGIGQYQR